MSNKQKDSCESKDYQRTQMQKEMILSKLKERGCRITKQRQMLLDIILANECSSCKEIFYKASRVDSKIGTATVYRMINALEDIGAISRKNMYRVAYSENCTMEDACTVILEDATTYHLSAKTWNRVVREGLEVCGYGCGGKIVSVSIKPCDCGKINERGAYEKSC